MSTHRISAGVRVPGALRTAESSAVELNATFHCDDLRTCEPALVVSAAPTSSVCLNALQTASQRSACARVSLLRGSHAESLGASAVRSRVVQHSVGDAASPPALECACAAGICGTAHDGH